MRLDLCPQSALKNINLGAFFFVVVDNFEISQGKIWSVCRLWAEIEAHKWHDLELNLSKTVEELSQDSQLIQANSKKKLRDNKKLLECSFAQI